MKSKSLKVLLPLFFVSLAMMLVSCHKIINPDPIPSPSDEPTYVDFVGAWKSNDSEPVYMVLNSDMSGIVYEFYTENGKTIRDEVKITWSYRYDKLILLDENEESYTYFVIAITEKILKLSSLEGKDETYIRVNKSDIPDGNGESSDDSGVDGDDGEEGGDYSGEGDEKLGTIQTIEAEPAAYSAMLKGQFKGGVLPTSLGFDYSYYPDFPQRYTKRISIDGKLGGFTLEARNILDLATIYYRAFAKVKDKEIYGEIKSFETLQGTYKIDGKEYKFIKVTGLSSGSFSMMQTELPPEAEFEINGSKVVLNMNNRNYITKGEMREFLNNDGPVLMRYPTPKEWIYAATGGSSSAGYIYSGSNNIDEVAWYSSNSNGHTKKPALKLPNELGFYDMSGNYAELTQELDDEELEGWIDVTLINTKIQDVSASKFNKMWKADGGAFGGRWDSSSDNCKTNSAIDVSSQTERNRIDITKYTIRWVYSRPD